MSNAHRAPKAEPFNLSRPSDDAGAEATAAQSLRLREEWTQLVAHDLKQPLSALRMHLAALARMPARSAEPQSQTPALERTIRHLRDSTELLARMIGDLEDIAALDVGELPIVRAPVQLGAHLATLGERLALVVAPHALRVDVRDPDVVVLCDRQRVDQVIGNLVANAHQYGHADTEIAVALESDEREVTVTISNSGDAIPPEERERVFERFHRVESGTRHAGHRFGLGLYICRGIVAAHGGRIWIEDGSASSEPRHWTHFRFALPRVSSAQ